MEYNGKKFKFNVDFVYHNLDDYYEINILNKQKEKAGYLTFKVYSDERKIWLNKIETNKKYQHMGIGKALLDSMEYFAMEHRLPYVEGKYYPTNDFAKSFYEKNGYMIFKDGYETYIDKYLDFEKIKAEVEPQIKNFEITKIDEIEKSK